MYALLLTALPVLFLPWQQPQPTPSVRSGARVDPAVVLGKTPTGLDVGLYYYRPTGLDPNRIIESVAPVHGRLTSYVDPSTGDERRVDNLRSFGDLLVLVDTIDRIELVRQTIEGLERESRDTSAASPLETLYYKPRYTSISNLRAALAPFDHQVYRQEQWVPTIASIEDGSALVIHSDEASVQAIEALLAQLDQSSPQVLLSAWVLLGGQQETTALPAELLLELRRMLPFENYAQASMGLVRTAVKPGGQVRIDLDAQHVGYALELSIGAHDRRTGALTFDSVSFSEDGDMRFAAATTVEAGRYTVLGAAGNPPLFVVLHAAPMNAASSAAATGPGGR